MKKAVIKQAIQDLKHIKSKLSFFEKNYLDDYVYHGYVRTLADGDIAKQDKIKEFLNDGLITEQKLIEVLSE